jgi:hypothetical protein
MKIFKTLGLLATGLLTGSVVAWLHKKYQTGIMLNQVADHGYETAYDFIPAPVPHRLRKIKFGPVLPE